MTTQDIRFVGAKPDGITIFLMMALVILAGFKQTHLFIATIILLLLNTIVCSSDT